ncbi:MAG: hypothetical protein IEMM0007_0418 [bacterium]|nr:MAG: hypothetical protein IEMM0007_0418 [bacterium]
MGEEKHLGQWDPRLLEYFIEMMNLTGYELPGHGTGDDLTSDEQKEPLLL